MVSEQAVPNSHATRSTQAANPVDNLVDARVFDLLMAVGQDESQAQVTRRDAIRAAQACSKILERRRQQQLRALREK